MTVVTIELYNSALDFTLFYTSHLDFYVKFMQVSTCRFVTRYSLFVFVPCFNAGNSFGTKALLNATGKD